eukprot:928055-Alexandrium_andersonii.AAC.1
MGWPWKATWSAPRGSPRMVPRWRRWCTSAKRTRARSAPSDTGIQGCRERATAAASRVWVKDTAS